MRCPCTPLWPTAAWRAAAPGCAAAPGPGAQAECRPAPVRPAPPHPVGKEAGGTCRAAARSAPAGPGQAVGASGLVACHSSNCKAVQAHVVVCGMFYKQGRRWTHRHAVWVDEMPAEQGRLRKYRHVTWVGGKPRTQCSPTELHKWWVDGLVLQHWGCSEAQAALCPSQAHQCQRPTPPAASTVSPTPCRTMPLWPPPRCRCPTSQHVAPHHRSLPCAPLR